MEPGEEVAGDRRDCLRFDRRESRRVGDHEVDLGGALIAIERKRGIRAGVKTRVQQLGNDEGLEDRAKLREIDELARATRAESEEDAKGPKVADVHDLADVALDVGRDVVAEPFVGIESEIADARIAAEQEFGLEFAGGMQRTRLRERERQEMKLRNATREGLRQLREQIQILRAGEDETPSLRSGIELFLWVGQDRRRAWHNVVLPD